MSRIVDRHFIFSTYMIATILSSSKNFNAVNYNERKVASGDAELLEIKNFGYVETLNLQGRETYIRYLKDYSQANRQDLKNAQFHAAISCKGHDWSKEQLLAFAHLYLKEMGYEGQPTLIYFHHDTDNNHLHIVTSRVKDGKKIDNRHERIRSQKTIDKLLGIHQETSAKKLIELALEYKFQNANQFMAILESQGYHCRKSESEIKLYKGGTFVGSVQTADLERQAALYSVQPNRICQIAAWLDKYKQACRNKEELMALMKQKFGIVLLFHGKEFSPYGYTIIDHAHKTVYKGSIVYPLKSLLGYTMKDELGSEKVSMKVKSKCADKNRMASVTTKQRQKQYPNTSSGKHINQGKIIGTVLGANGYTAVGKGGDDPRKKKRFDDDEALNQVDRGRSM